MTRRGWALMGDRGKWHCFGFDGKSLCKRWKETTQNKLAWDVHPDNQCVMCRRILLKPPKFKATELVPSST